MTLTLHDHALAVPALAAVSESPVQPKVNTCQELKQLQGRAAQVSE